MKYLAKKLSFASLRGRRDASTETIPEHEPRKSSAVSLIEKDESRNSTNSSAYDSDGEDDLKKNGQSRNLLERVNAIPPERDDSLHQSFSRNQSPYPIGRHGLYELSSSDTLPPPLPPATPGLEYGKTSPVVIAAERFGVPGKICSIYDVLHELPPVPEIPPNFLEKCARKKKQVKAFMENPKADPEFAGLPKGINNRVDSDKKDRDAQPFKEKVRRAFGATPARNITPIVFEQAPPSLPFSPDLPTPSTFAAPPRYIPKIAAHKKIQGGAVYDDNGNPFGGEPILFHETEVEREKRLKQAEEGREHRKASDHYLSLSGRRQTNDSVIGRPPPISQRKLSEPARLTEATVKRLVKQREDGEKAETIKVALQLWTKIEGIHEAQIKNTQDEAKRLAEARGINISKKEGIVGAVARRYEERMQRNDAPRHQSALEQGTVRGFFSDAEAASADIESLRVLEASSTWKMIQPPVMTICQLLATPTAPSNTELLRRARLASIHKPTLGFKGTTEQPPSTSIRQPQEQSTPVIEEHDGSTPPLPGKGSRASQWDEAFRAGKTPVLVPAVTPPRTPLPKLPDHSPPPIPSAAREPSPFNALGISSGSAASPLKGVKSVWHHPKEKRKKNDGSDSDSDYSDVLPPDEEEHILEKQRSLRKRSEKFAESYQSEVDLARKQVANMVRYDKAREVEQAQSVARNPFHNASPRRKDHWIEATEFLNERATMVKSPSQQSYDWDKLKRVCRDVRDFPDYYSQQYAQKNPQAPYPLAPSANDSVVDDEDGKDDEGNDEDEDADDIPIRVGEMYNPPPYYDGYGEEHLQPSQYELWSNRYEYFESQRGPFQHELLMPVLALQSAQQDPFVEPLRPRQPVRCEPLEQNRPLKPWRHESVNSPYSLKHQKEVQVSSGTHHSVGKAQPQIGPLPTYRAERCPFKPSRFVRPLRPSREEIQLPVHPLPSYYQERYEQTLISSHLQTLLQQQDSKSSSQEVDSKRFEFKGDSHVEDIEEIDAVAVAPRIPARSSLRAKAEKQFPSQRAFFPVIPSVSSLPR